MAKSRSVNLRALVTSIQPVTFLRFLALMGIDEAEARWLHLDTDRFFAFTLQSDNVDRCEPLLDELDRLGEVVTDGPGLIVRAYRRYGLDFDEAASPGELAMLLYLDNRHAFDFARSKFLLYGGGTTLSVYRLDAEHIRFDATCVENMRASVSAWFAQQAKGHQCDVGVFDDKDEVVLLVQRGEYVQTRPIWDGDAIVPSTARPAIEDVLTWDREAGELRIRTRLFKDRDEYLRLFAHHFCGNERLAERARQEVVFSLDPIAHGSFNYQGHGIIKAVTLREVKLELHGVSRGIVTLKADSVREMLQWDLPSITLQSGSLLAARFQFTLKQPGVKRDQHMTFTIEPPARTDIGERRNVLAVLAYLEEQGVKLR